MRKYNLNLPLKKVVGFIVTILLLLTVAPTIFGEIKEKGISFFIVDIPNSFLNWSDDPIAPFFTYIIGYAIVWWKPLWGSMIIMVGSTISFIMSPSLVSLIFVIPMFLVGLLYWIDERKSEVKGGNL